MPDKVAVVTGSSKGLGYAIVKRLCERVDFQGIVYLTSRDEQRGRKACQELKQAGLNPVYHQLDVADEESISRFSNYIKERHGNVDILINNAGILFLQDTKESKLFQAQETIKVNFLSLVNFTEAMLPLIKDGGTIVNISSSSGHLSRIPSEELRRRFSSVGIRVNCIHPGYVRSDMTRGAGNVTPEAAAEAPVHLGLQARTGGLYVWHNGAEVLWDGPDPRDYIDGKGN